jgi:hypothetical protein
VAPPLDRKPPSVAKNVDGILEDPAGGKSIAVHVVEGTVVDVGILVPGLWESGVGGDDGVWAQEATEVWPVVSGVHLVEVVPDGG